MRHFKCWPLCILLSLVALGCGDPEENQTNNTTNNSKTNNTASVLAISSTVPTQNASSVGLNQSVKLTFNLEVDPDSLEDGAASVNPIVPGAWQWSADAKTLAFVPSDGWRASTSYRVTVKAGLKPKSGDPLKDDVVLDFSTSSQMMTGQTGTYTSGNDRVTVQIDNRESATRTYTMKTTAALRDNDPADKQVVIKEQDNQPTIRTGHDVFDALFAMAWEETRQNSVSAISDGAFNQGQGVNCECFETGAKWNYVWTRDTAYAVDLGLAFVDPQRSMRSLDFKLSERKGGGGIQIVQDTGSGGSYPVSTDRVVWALGALDVLKHLSGAERDAFRDRTLAAAKNTIEQDRQMVFDPADGLYRGEQSFLDWREQSYASRTRDNTVELGLSKALSTNVGHYAVLDLAAKLATETGDTASADRYRMWAQSLKMSIRSELWLEDAGMFSTFKIFGAPTKKYDMLGTALAILTGVASPEQASKSMAAYPHVAFGPPVLWPQQPLIPIYHNRGIWPFVTAYAVLAARAVDNDKAFDLNMESLIRGAALNLSNMENFEFQTQQPWYDDGDYSGPVVNSRRQLWSVAGYIGAVVHGVFGFEANQTAVRFAPFVTAQLHKTYWAEQSELTLNALSYKGKRINVTIELPDSVADAGVYTVASATLNGQNIDVSQWIEADTLMATNDVRVVLGVARDTASQLTVVSGEDFKLYWSPRDPTVTSVQLSEGTATVAFDAGGEAGVKYNLYEDGRLIASALDTPTWQGQVADAANRAPCYTVESYFPESNNHSHLSAPVCAFDGNRDVSLSVYDMFVSGGQAQWSIQHGKPHFQDYGESDDVLAVHNFQPTWSGTYQLSAEYGNGAGPINTGITAAVKWVEISPMDDPSKVQRAILVMPHLADWSRWVASTTSNVTLEAGVRYQVLIKDGINMSYFAHFEPYTGGLGGGQTTYNNVNIHKLDLRLLNGQPGALASVNPIALDGNADMDKLGATQQLDPGAKGQVWERFALAWDDRYLYGVMVSESFEDPYRPLMIYFETGDGLAAAPVPSKGISYSNLQPELPFTPTMALTFRNLSDDGNGAPYNGVWLNQGADWLQVRRFEQGKTWWLSADKHTLSFRIPRAWLGGTSRVRMVAHVVHAANGAEWRVTVPSTSTPWQAGGGYYEIDFGASSSVDTWSLK